MKAIAICIFMMLSLAYCRNSDMGLDQNQGFQSKIEVAELKTAPVKLIPFPQEVSWGKKKIRIGGINFIKSDIHDENIRIELDKISREAGFNSKKDGIDLKIILNEDISQEGYKLSVEKKLIQIESSSYNGVFYALQSLRQLILKEPDKNLIQACSMYDFPAHPFRGFMLDVGRNYQSMASLKKQLDIMASYKLNTFHWHLTDRPAWRIESRMYPQLNAAENHRPTRDPGKFYAYDEIRELIKYAKNLNIQIIPEIDMPGHSDSFITSMGVKMESPAGMEILENILEEFFSEISVELCPFIHLGSDEVRIPNPDEFINKMVKKCEDNGRKVIIWNPGLKANNRVIRQTWQAQHLEKADYAEIDSWNNYINNDEPHNTVSKLFFKPISYRSDNETLGSILCLWPDVNIDNEEDAFNINPVYPALICHAWACWTADVTEPYEGYLTMLPGKGTKASVYFEAFEDFILDHKERFFENMPFPYFRQANREWKIALSSDGSTDSISDWISARGNTLIFQDRFKLGGYFPEALPGSIALAETTLKSDSEKEIEVLIGFETALRANRTYSGIPENGSWDANGGEIWLNGKEIPGPLWENPGWKPSKSSGWGSAEDQEIPWTAEELYWTRQATKIKLKKGDNILRITAPFTNNYQNWMITFIILD